MRDRGLGVNRRRVGRHPREALPQLHPRFEARPVRLGHVALTFRVQPRIGKEHGQHLLPAAIPHSEAPRVATALGVEVAEEGDACTAAPRRELGRRGEGGAAAVRADAEMKVPRAAARHVDRDVAIEERDGWLVGESAFEDCALDARAEDDLSPVLLEARAEKRQERGFGALDVEVLGARAVEVEVADQTA